MPVVYFGKNIDQDTDWQIDAVLIEIDSVSKRQK